MRWGMRDLAMDPIHMAVNDRPGNRAMLHRWMQPPISCSMYLGRYKLIEQIIFSMIILNDHFVKKEPFYNLPVFCNFSHHQWYQNKHSTTNKSGEKSTNIQVVWVLCNNNEHIAGLLSEMTQN